MGTRCHDSKHYGDLEIACDPRTLRGELIAEHISWAVMALLVLLALAGLLGSGPLSHTTVRTSQGEITYDRLQRVEVQQELRLRVRSAGAPLRLSLGRGFTRRIELGSITPGPDSVELSDREVTYVFGAVPPGKDLLVSLSYQPMHVGRLVSPLRVNDTPAGRLSSFVYP